MRKNRQKDRKKSFLYMDNPFLLSPFFLFQRFQLSGSVNREESSPREHGSQSFFSCFPAVVGLRKAGLGGGLGGGGFGKVCIGSWEGGWNCLTLYGADIFSRRTRTSGLLLHFLDLEDVCLLDASNIMVDPLTKLH